MVGNFVKIVEWGNPVNTIYCHKCAMLITVCYKELGFHKFIYESRHSQIKFALYLIACPSLLALKLLLVLVRMTVQQVVLITACNSTCWLLLSDPQGSSAYCDDSLMANWPLLSIMVVSSPPPIHSLLMKTRGT